MADIKKRPEKTSPDNAYEKAVKNAILYNNELFKDILPLGKSSVIFEKVCGDSLIADCLIFSQNRGIIGVEIKTAHDSLKRLSKQLDDYVKVCTYVYVFVHDSHLEHVLALLKNKGMLSYVGVISYEEFGDELIAGVYQRAYKSIKYNLFYSVDMLWKDQIMQTITLHTNRAERLAANTTGKVSNRSDAKFHRGGRGAVANTKTSKYNLRKTYVNMFGEVRGTRLLVEQFLVPQPNPDRVLKLYHFITPEVYHAEMKRLGIQGGKEK